MTECVNQIDTVSSDKEEECKQMTDLGIAISHAIQLDYWTQWINVLERKTPMDQYISLIYKDAMKMIKENQISYLYFGNSFCQYDLPSLEEVKTVLTYCEENKIQLILVTPPVTDFGIEKIRQLLKLFQKSKESNIVINDFGVLELVKEVGYKGHIILGRVLDKTIREFRLTDNERIQYYSERGKDYMNTAASTSSYYSAVLKKYNIRRVQMDISDVIYKKNPELEYDCIMPSEYITTGRMCLFRIASQSEEEKYLLNNSCKKYCNFQKQMLIKPIDYLKFDSEGNRIRELRMIRKGNTLFTLRRFLYETEINERLVFDLDMIY